jgi:hypothetical protein
LLFSASVLSALVCTVNCKNKILKNGAAKRVCTLNCKTEIVKTGAARRAYDSSIYVCILEYCSTVSSEEYQKTKRNKKKNLERAIRTFGNKFLSSCMSV